MGPARWLALGSLLALGAPLEGRLVGEGDAGFGECDQFFYAGTPPEGLAAEGHVKICQRSAGTERFATLYSTGDRIPVYSAFRAPRPAPAGAEPRWLVEPQDTRRLGGRKAEFMSHERPFLILGCLYHIWTMVPMITSDNSFTSEWSVWDD